MKIQYTLLSLPFLLVFSSCDSDSSSPAENLEPVSIIGKTVNFSGVQAQRTTVLGFFIDLDLQLQEQITFNGSIPLRSEGVRTVTSSTSSEGVPDPPQAGDVLPFSDLFDYAYIFDPTQNVGTITIFDSLDTNVDLVREIRFVTPVSGTWTETGSGLSPGGFEYTVSGSGTFVILE